VRRQVGVSDLGYIKEGRRVIPVTQMKLREECSCKAGVCRRAVPGDGGRQGGDPGHSGAAPECFGVFPGRSGGFPECSGVSPECSGVSPGRSAVFPECFGGDLERFGGAPERSRAGPERFGIGCEWLGGRGDVARRVTSVIY
jgi:hypothetical protein